MTEANVNTSELTEKLKSLNDRLQQSPEDAGLLAQRAVIHYQLGGYRDAAIDARGALAVDENVAKLQLIVAFAQFDDGDVDAAKAAVQKSIEIDAIHGGSVTDVSLGFVDEDRAVAQYLMAEIFLEENKVDQALQAVNRAIGLFTQRALFFSTRADIHFEKGDVDLALKDLDLAIGLSPNDLSIHMDKIEGLTHAQKCDDAIKAVDAAKAVLATQPDPQLDAALSTLKAEAYLTMGDDLRARAEFKNVLMINETDPRANLGLADIAVRTRDFANADKYLIQAASGDADEEELSLLRGILEHSREDYAKALDSFQKTVRLNPESGAAYFYLSLVKRQLGMEDAAADENRAKALGFEVQI